MGKMKTHKQYVDELLVKNPTIEVIDQYIDARTPIQHYCKKHDVFWCASPDNILRGCECPECGKEKTRSHTKRTHEEYIKQVTNVNPNIEVIEEYKGANPSILHKCKIDGYEWRTTPANILYGKGCPKCAGNLSLSNAEYVERLRLINHDIISIEQYVNMKTPILHICLIDGYTWYASPDSILQGCGCPICKESYGERQIRQILEEYNLKYIYQKTFMDCRDKNPLPFDFYLPDYNICIEYDGEQHFRSVDFFGGEDKFEKQKLHDQIKIQYCNNNHIHLLKIPYFKNVKAELEKFFIHLI